jgi:adenosinetriphosphatase
VDYSQTILKDVEKRSWAFLGATAGMRLLNETNPTAAKDIMGNVTNYLKSQPVRYGRSSIISGIQEAIDGWIAVNYLKHDVRLQHMLGSNGYPVM